MNNQPIRVLIVEDDQEDYLLAKHYLKEIGPDAYSIDWVDNYERAIHTIAQQEHDVYLIDYNLGNNTGVDLVRQATTSGILKPFIFLTGMDNKAVDENALAAGAVDFLIKHKINKDLLERSIRYAIHQKETERELKESNNTKNKLFSIISHDLRSPLTSFISSLEFLTESDKSIDDKVLNVLLKELGKTASSTLGLLDNLLNWSRSQIGALQLEKSEFNLHELTNQVFELIESNRKQKSIDLINAVEPDITMKSDKNALNLILRNLCSNAKKFTPELGRIQVSSTTTPNGTRIEVKDSGIGMDKLAIQKVLNRRTFFTTYGTNNEKGSGLGMVIVLEFIEKLGSELEIESEPGKGSTFAFEINNE